ncbi:MAG TPA: choice-of-anchor R domain-containing protein [Caulobacteraceae bacterium]
MRRVWLSSLSLACVLGVASAAGATVLYDNLGAGSSGVDPASSFGPLADSFSTGGGSFNLKAVTVLIDGTSTDGGAFTVSLLADNSTSPGAVIVSTGSISDSVLDPTLTAETFDLSATLSPGTRYWIEISSVAGDVPSSLDWSWSLDTSGTGVAGEFFSNTNGVVANSGGPYQMFISDTVPEAPVWALLMAGFGALGAVLRRRSRLRTAYGT